MKKLTGPSRVAIVPVIIATLGFAMDGCSLFHHHHEPKSSFKIIGVGDRNPNIINDPTIVSQTPTTEVTVERGPVQ